MQGTSGRGYLKLGSGRATIEIGVGPRYHFDIYRKEVTSNF